MRCSLRRSRAVRAYRYTAPLLAVVIGTFVFASDTWAQSPLAARDLDVDRALGALKDPEFLRLRVSSPIPWWLPQLGPQPFKQERPQAQSDFRVSPRTDGQRPGPGPQPRR